LFRCLGLTGATVDFPTSVIKPPSVNQRDSPASSEMYYVLDNNNTPTHTHIHKSSSSVQDYYLCVVLELDFGSAIVVRNYLVIYSYTIVIAAIL